MPRKLEEKKEIENGRAEDRKEKNEERSLAERETRGRTIWRRFMID